MTETTADIESCDREPIHIPGSIQPHGVLLSLEPATLRILQASRNAAAVFGREVKELLGTPVTELCAPEQARELGMGLENPQLEKSALYFTTLRLKAENGEPCHYRALGHRHKNALILELESAAGPDEFSFQHLYPLVASFLTRLQEVQGVAELSQLAAEETRRITGFDRVLVYRFTEDWHGHVIAEARSEEFGSYMDLWFPASDIPAQARELYRVNRLRLIADAHYEPIPLIPALDPQSGAPLDLSHATLRSVSPVHLEYLRNMGVTASMSISIIRDGALWGLIALHHKTKRIVPYEVRLACDLLGQTLSSSLAAQENKQEYEHRLRLKSIMARLLGFMAEEEHFIHGLTNHADELLAFAGAAGAAILYEGKCALMGQAPPEAEVWRIVDWLAWQKNEEVFSTDRLPSLMAAEGSFAASACGVLAISISMLYRSYVLWFRPEVVQTVKWSGDPRKSVAPEPGGTMRIHPRKSFEAWKETVRGRSLPWRASELESAAELRNAVVGVVLRKAEEVAALSAELKRSNSELEAFSYSVSHDLRAPFRHIAGYSELLSDHLGAALDDTARRYLTTIAGAAESAGTLVDNLLNFSRIGRAKVHRIEFDMGVLVREVKVEFYPEEEGRSVHWTIPALPVVNADPVLLRMVWQNLFSNALKYTRRRDRTEITVGYKETEDENVFFVRDNGIGFNQHYVNKLFGVFQRLHSSDEFEGTGIGLANVRRAIGKLGGQTWAEGEVEKGATFFFSLPKRGQAGDTDA